MIMNTITDFILSSEGVLTILLLVVSLGSVWMASRLDSEVIYWREEYWKKCDEIYDEVQKRIELSNRHMDDLKECNQQYQILLMKHQINLKTLSNGLVIKIKQPKRKSTTLPNHRGKKSISRKHK